MTNKTRILLVVDDDLVRANDKRIFEEAGCLVIEANPYAVSAEGLANAAAQWDVAVIEWQHGGPDLVRGLRQDEQSARKPIIGVSSSAAPELVVEAKSAGISGWIVRPITQPAERIAKAIERAAG